MAGARSEWGAVDLKTIPSVSLGVLGLVVLLHLLLTVFAVVVFSQPPSSQSVFSHIWMATDGFISAQLLVNLCLLLTIVGVQLWYDDELEPGHIGLDVDSIPMGLVVTGLLWLGIQAIGMGLDVVGGRVGVSAALTGIGAACWIVRIFPEFYGSALEEEMI